MQTTDTDATAPTMNASDLLNWIPSILGVKCCTV